MSGTLLGPDLGGAGDGRGGVEDDGGDSLGYSHHIHAITSLAPAVGTRQHQAGLDICDVRSYKQPNTLSVHLPGRAMLLYLNTRSNIETKGQMSGPKPEPASGGKRGKGLGARVTRQPGTGSPWSAYRAGTRRG